jgi:hypothetical protein
VYVIILAPYLVIRMLEELIQSFMSHTLNFNVNCKGKGDTSFLKCYHIKL